MADQMHDWVSSKSLPASNPPEGFSTVYRNGSSDYNVGYAYLIEDGSYQGRKFRSEKWPASYEYKEVGIREVTAQTAARAGCVSTFEGRFHVPNAWLKTIFDEEDLQLAEVAMALAGLGYAPQDEQIRYQGAKGYIGTIERQNLIEATRLDDGTLIGWFRDYGKRSVTLLKKE